LDYSIIGFKLPCVKGHCMAKSVFSKDYESFLGTLRRVRLDAGLTQNDVADRLGWTQTQISKSERGERRLDLVELRNWCHALGMTLPAFVQLLEPQLSKPPRSVQVQRS
jgi:transcriptional regulator with XRE-family HTH domain